MTKYYVGCIDVVDDITYSYSLDGYYVCGAVYRVYEEKGFLFSSQSVEKEEYCIFYEEASLYFDYSWSDAVFHWDYTNDFFVALL